jgi:serine/threonine protein kinase
MPQLRHLSPLQPPTPQVSEHDIFVIKTLGRGASSVVRARGAGMGAGSEREHVGGRSAGGRGRATGVPEYNPRLGPPGPPKVFKGFLMRESRFVALKKINILQKVGAERGEGWGRRGKSWGRWGRAGRRRVPAPLQQARAGWRGRRARRRRSARLTASHSPLPSPPHPLPPTQPPPPQETRAQMMNDVKALCDAPNVPGLINFYGAYHVPDSGQVGGLWERGGGGGGLVGVGIGRKRGRWPARRQGPPCPPRACRGRGLSRAPPPPPRPPPGPPPTLPKPHTQISIVLEYMDGGSLADVLARVGRIPEGVLSRITGRVLQGLAFLHRKHLVREGGGCRGWLSARRGSRERGRALV